MLEGRWYLAFLNDGIVQTTVRFSAHLIGKIFSFFLSSPTNVRRKIFLFSDDEIKECKYNCYEKGVCNEGKCHCFNGYTGVYCEESA